MKNLYDVPFDFGIVIPVRDYTPFFKICLLSILSQEGDYSAHVHVQDGGADERVSVETRQLFNSFQRAGISLTHSIQRDSGPAEAIARGFSLIEANFLTWLGSDDFLMPGSLAAIKSFASQHPSFQWVTGIPNIVSASGISTATMGSLGIHRVPTGYSSNALRYGMHSSPFNHGTIQQEGTFWSRELYETVGGIDTSFSFAFDFDLWTRFAEVAELVELVLPLAAFRKREGQVSSNKQAYAEEVRKVRLRQTSKFPPIHWPVRFERVLVAYHSHSPANWHLWSGRFIAFYGIRSIRRIWLVGVTKFLGLSLPSLFLRLLRSVLGRFPLGFARFLTNNQRKIARGRRRGLEE